jgi:O-antigen ligase
MQNKTELFSVFFMFFVITLSSVHNQLYVKRILILIICLVVVSFSSYSLIVDTLGEEQFMLFIERVNENDSYNARVPIWKNVFEYVVTNPKVFLIGIGPDVSIRLGEAPFFDKLFSNMGIREYAVDSNYLTFLLNYGLILTVFFVSRIVVILRIAFNKNYYQKTKNYLVYPILVWLLMGFTQLHGISKPAFLLIFYMAVGYNFLNNKQISVNKM